MSFGAVGILISDFYESVTLAFIGLTLTFWGCLLFLVLPGKYVKSEVMNYLSISSLLAIDQMITDSNVQGKPIYIPVLKESYLPIQMGVKNEFAYIPNIGVEEGKAIEQAFMRNSPGLRLTPPGLGLVNLMEKKFKQSFHNLNMDSLIETLPQIITQELEIANKFRIRLEGNEVHVQIVKSVCEDLCKEANKMQHICPYIGCPISSSIACILTRVTNKPVIIERCSIRYNNIETCYRIL